MGAPGLPEGAVAPMLTCADPSYRASACTPQAQLAAIGVLPGPCRGAWGVRAPPPPSSSSKLGAPPASHAAWMEGFILQALLQKLKQVSQQTAMSALSRAAAAPAATAAAAAAHRGLRTVAAAAAGGGLSAAATQHAAPMLQQRHVSMHAAAAGPQPQMPMAAAHQPLSPVAPRQLTPAPRSSRFPQQQQQQQRSVSTAAAAAAHTAADQEEPVALGCLLEFERGGGYQLARAVKPLAQGWQVETLRCACCLRAACALAPQPALRCAARSCWRVCDATAPEHPEPCRHHCP